MAKTIISVCIVTGLPIVGAVRTNSNENKFTDDDIQKAIKQLNHLKDGYEDLADTLNQFKMEDFIKWDVRNVPVQTSSNQVEEAKATYEFFQNKVEHIENTSKEKESGWFAKMQDATKEKLNVGKSSAARNKELPFYKKARDVFKTQWQQEKKQEQKNKEDKKTAFRKAIVPAFENKFEEFKKKWGKGLELNFYWKDSSDLASSWKSLFAPTTDLWHSNYENISDQCNKEGNDYKPICKHLFTARSMQQNVERNGFKNAKNNFESGFAKEYISFAEHHGVQRSQQSHI